MSNENYESAGKGLNTTFVVDVAALIIMIIMIIIIIIMKIININITVMIYFRSLHRYLRASWFLSSTLM